MWTVAALHACDWLSAPSGPVRTQREEAPCWASYHNDQLPKAYCESISQHGVDIVKLCVLGRRTFTALTAVL